MDLICLGDSLTFGLGVRRGRCWTALFAEESGWNVSNRGISGDTTSGMLARLHRDLAARADRVTELVCGLPVHWKGGAV